MDPSACPVPDLATALQSYIRPRDEVLKIRSGLQQHLNQQTTKDAAPLTNINLANPDAHDLRSASPSLSGVRRAYYRALEAHLAAQAKYDGLRADLEQLQRPQDTSHGLNGVDTSGQSSTDYIALLRQKERHRKLTVIERALSSVATDENLSSSPNSEDAIKQKIGELPVPPPTQPALSRDPEADAKIMELKKAVVSTKRRVDQHRKDSANQALQPADSVPVEAEVAGLQKALQELTIWMEDHLTIIADAEAETQGRPNGAEDTDATNGVQITTEDIEALYDQYLEARHRLVRNVNDFAAADHQDDPADSEWLSEISASRTINAGHTSNKANAAALVPYIATLAAVKQEEQSLVQQSAFVRRQLNTAESENARLMQRLAGESHLVEPGAARGSDWANAAKNAAKATEESARERLKAGESFAKSAQETHDAIKSLPDTLVTL